MAVTWREGLTARRALVFARDVGDAAAAAGVVAVALGLAIGMLAVVAFAGLLFEDRAPPRSTEPARGPLGVEVWS